MKRRLRHARHLMDHQRTLQLQADSLSGQVVFSSRICSKLSQYGVSKRNWDGGRYKSVQCLNIYNVEQVGKRFSQITEK